MSDKLEELVKDYEKRVIGLVTAADDLEEARRVLEELLDGVGEAGDRRAVDDAVVRGPRDRRDGRGLQAGRQHDGAVVNKLEGVFQEDLDEIWS